MDWAAHNAGYVAAAYSICASTVMVMVSQIFLQDRRNAKRADSLKATDPKKND